MWQLYDPGPFALGWSFKTSGLVVAYPVFPMISCTWANPVPDTCRWSSFLSTSLPFHVRMKIPFLSKQKDDGNESPPLTHLSPASVDPEKRRRRRSSFDESRVPWVTWRSLVLGAFVSIGGLIFGYDTGQISGFLEMKNYRQRYGQLKNGTYTFSNVRSGLIVSLV